MNGLLVISVLTLTYVAFVLCKTALFIACPHKRCFWPSWKIDLENKKREKSEEFAQRIDALLDWHPELINDIETFEEITRIRGL